MARVKISEYKAKVLLHKFLGLPYSGVSLHKNFNEGLKDLDSLKRFVVKVDGGIKKRFKTGLMAINKSSGELQVEIERLKGLGYKHFIVEEFVVYSSDQEKYLSIERVREGFQVLYSSHGGVDIEEDSGETKRLLVKVKDDEKIVEQELGLPQGTLEKILECMNQYYFSFLEINPLIVNSLELIVLDLAVEVDSAGKFFVEGAWTEDDYRFGDAHLKTIEEKNIDDLSSKSQASFKFVVLNPNGSVFMLLSGGGASIVLADEVANLGRGNDLANYGEYSGNPNEQETYLYTKNLLSLLIKSSSPKKALILAGGVANFTDVRITFKGIVNALDEVKSRLQEQNVKVFVRRGGPNQEEGLEMISFYLEENNLLGEVKGPDMVLTDIVKVAVESLQT